ncbi:MAG TPA: cytochrome c oxidase subunit II [Rhizobiaceae bacterium]|nr:cytochrome c oxidase subunit II [Rhizobiaceae bacterium]
MTRWAAGCVLFSCLATAGCSGVQSALDPAGEEALQISRLFQAMLIGGAAIWLSVVALLLYAIRQERRRFSEAASGKLILWGGGIFPSVTLLLLLAFGLWQMPSLRPAAQAATAGGLRIEVTGKQFWWSVVYRRPEAAPIVSANEIRLPVGERVELLLKSDDVIHSFWIPALAGKVDMIPGRTNRLSLLANKSGSFRGPCAEYCGTSHALMAFSAIAMEPAAFREWLEAKARPADGAARSGQRLFIQNGCGACHRVAGSEAQGAIGPDLSHLGSRATLGAGILPNTKEAIARFIADPDAIKPGAKMPAFHMLPPQDIEAIADYLKGLQ